MGKKSRRRRNRQSNSTSEGGTTPGAPDIQEPLPAAESTPATMPIPQSADAVGPTNNTAPLLMPLSSQALQNIYDNLWTCISQQSLAFLSETNEKETCIRQRMSKAKACGALENISQPVVLPLNEWHSWHTNAAIACDPVETVCAYHIMWRDWREIHSFLDNLPFNCNQDYNPDARQGAKERLTTEAARLGPLFPGHFEEEKEILKQRVYAMVQQHLDTDVAPDVHASHVKDVCQQLLLSRPGFYARLHSTITHGVSQPLDAIQRQRRYLDRKREELTNIVSAPEDQYEMLLLQGFALQSQQDLPVLPQPYFLYRAYYYWYAEFESAVFTTNSNDSSSTYFLDVRSRAIQCSIGQNLEEFAGRSATEIEEQKRLVQDFFQLTCARESIIGTEADGDPHDGMVTADMICQQMLDQFGKNAAEEAACSERVQMNHNCAYNGLETFRQLRWSEEARMNRLSSRLAKLSEPGSRVANDTIALQDFDAPIKQVDSLLEKMILHCDFIELRSGLNSAYFNVKQNYDPFVRNEEIRSLAVDVVTQGPLYPELWLDERLICEREVCKHIRNHYSDVVPTGCHNLQQLSESCREEVFSEFQNVFLEDFQPTRCFSGCTSHTSIRSRQLRQMERVFDLLNKNSNLPLEEQEGLLRIYHAETFSRPPPKVPNIDILREMCDFYQLNWQFDREIHSEECDCQDDCFYARGVSSLQSALVVCCDGMSPAEKSLQEQAAQQYLRYIASEVGAEEALVNSEPPLSSEMTRNQLLQEYKPTSRSFESSSNSQPTQNSSQQTPIDVEENVVNGWMSSEIQRGRSVAFSMENRQQRAAVRLNEIEAVPEQNREEYIRTRMDEASSKAILESHQWTIEDQRELEGEWIRRLHHRNLAYIGCATNLGPLYPELSSQERYISNVKSSEIAALLAEPDSCEAPTLQIIPEHYAQLPSFPNQLFPILQTIRNISVSQEKQAAILNERLQSAQSQPHSGQSAAQMTNGNNLKHIVALASTYQDMYTLVFHLQQQPFDVYQDYDPMVRRQKLCLLAIEAASLGRLFPESEGEEEAFIERALLRYLSVFSPGLKTRGIEILDHFCQAENSGIALQRQESDQVENAQAPASASTQCGSCFELRTCCIDAGRRQLQLLIEHQYLSFLRATPSENFIQVQMDPGRKQLRQIQRQMAMMKQLVPAPAEQHESIINWHQERQDCPRFPSMPKTDVLFCILDKLQQDWTQHLASCHPSQCSNPDRCFYELCKKVTSSIIAERTSRKYILIADTQPLQNQLRNYLAVTCGAVSCQLCSRSRKKLMVLHCGHSFCRQCIIQHGDQDTSCPVCASNLCCDIHRRFRKYPRDVDICFWCNAKTPPKTMKVCEVCQNHKKIVSYCSPECQEAAWRVHKKTAPAHQRCQTVSATH